MLSHTSTEWAPWYVIPADRKWFARIGAGAVLVNTLMEIDPRFPTVTKEQREVSSRSSEALEAQAPEGAHPTRSSTNRRLRRPPRATAGTGTRRTLRSRPA